MIRVAVVDGQQMFLDVIAGLFTGADIDVVAAVRTWPDLITHPSYPPDVVLLDIQLDDDVPASDKIQAVREAGGRVVVISVATDAARTRACLAAGAHAFVGKADDGPTVVGAVVAAMRGRQYLSPRVAAELKGAELKGAELKGAELVRPAPALSPQEARTLSLYASGLPLKNVARVLGVSYETAKSYLDRVRAKYRAVGRTAGSKVELRTRALEDGHLAE